MVSKVKGIGFAERLDVVAEKEYTWPEQLEEWNCYLLS